MAQLVEQRIRNAWVGGSSPPIGSNCGNSSVGRALASQAEGHGFEPRLPLIFLISFPHTFLFTKQSYPLPDDRTARQLYSTDKNQENTFQEKSFSFIW